MSIEEFGSQMPVTAIRTWMTELLKTVKEQGDQSLFEIIRGAAEALEAVLVKYGVSLSAEHLYYCPACSLN